MHRQTRQLNGKTSTQTERHDRKTVEQKYKQIKEEVYEQTDRQY